MISLARSVVLIPLALAFGMSLGTVELAAQTNWYVQGDGTPAGTGTQSDPFGSIQQGIDAASAGDLVLVGYSTYRENIDFRGKAIRVRGNGFFEPVLIPQGAGPGVSFVSGEGADSRLEGLRVFTSGFPTATRGMVCRASSPVLVDCEWFGHRTPAGSTGYGGNVLLEGGAAPAFLDCFLAGGFAEIGGGNVAVLGGSRLTALRSSFEVGFAIVGGGVYLDRTSSAMLRNCWVRNNNSDFGAVRVDGGSLRAEDCTFEANKSQVHGGALALFGARVDLLHCRFRGNEAQGSQAPFLGEGGAMYSAGSQVLFEDCELRRNVADVRGGALRAFGGRVEVVRCRLRENETFSEACAVSGVDSDIAIRDSFVVLNRIPPPNTFPGVDGAILVRGGSLVLLRSTVAVNQTRHASGGGLYAEGAQVDVQGTIFWQNDPSSYVVDPTTTLNVSFSDVQGGAPGQGNIDQDPLFLSILDHRLQAGSPCIDRLARLSPAPLDVERDPRRAGTGMDMGADEWFGWARLRSYGAFRSYGFGELGVRFRGNFFSWLAISPARLPVPISLTQGDWYLAPPIVIVNYGGSPGGDGLVGIQVPPIPGRVTLYAQVFNYSQLTNLLELEVGG